MEQFFTSNNYFNYKNFSNNKSLRESSWFKDIISTNILPKVLIVKIIKYYDYKSSKFGKKC